MASNPAQLGFSINGKDIGNVITASLPVCTWTQFYTTWNSGNNNTATISMVNKNIQVQGNDFALDDISFAPVIYRRDSVIIKVERPVIKTNNDTVICNGSSVQLNTTGAANYSWIPERGLSHNNISNPVVTPLASTAYIVTGTTVNGCSARDTVFVNVFPKANISVSNDTAICGSTPLQLFASGGISYLWAPAAALNDASVADPIAVPTAKTLYTVQVADINNCLYRDSVTVTIRAARLFSATPDRMVCEGTSSRLNATGGDRYLWSPATYLDDPSHSSPRASPLASIQYTVMISDTVCNYDSTITINLTLRPNPVVTASRSNDITCTNPTSQLLAIGAVSYLWSPAIAVDNAHIANPVTSINSTTLLRVTGIDQFGCEGFDTVMVKVTNEGKAFFLVPNAFTPNNDGKNDCFGIRHWGNAEVAQLSVYNRWGVRVFSTTDPSQCWNGYYKGILQATGGYAYIIKAKGFCGDIVRKGMVLLVR
ncbi:MAG: gliding motility-associated C-terminal domain-containing protein [Chitinophagaceae bacterium]